MKAVNRKTVIVFVLGMLTFAVGAVLYTVFLNPRRPEPPITVENRGEICFWIDDEGDMIASVSPEGCFSPGCTHQAQKVGRVIVDKWNFKLSFETTFVLTETSRFPFPCIDDCSGGGTINFNLGMLDVGDYSVWLGNENIGKLMVFSGLPTPRQCLPEQPIGCVIRTGLRTLRRRSSCAQLSTTWSTDQSQNPSINQFISPLVSDV